MISDVLSEAVGRVREYLGDPVYANTYSGELRQQLLALTEQMERMRVTLDTPPASPAQLVEDAAKGQGLPYAFSGPTSDGLGWHAGFRDARSGLPVTNTRYHEAFPAIVDSVLHELHSSWLGDSVSEFVGLVMARTKAFEERTTQQIRAVQQEMAEARAKADAALAAKANVTERAASPKRKRSRELN